MDCDLFEFLALSEKNLIAQFGEREISLENAENEAQRFAWYHWLSDLSYVAENGYTLRVPRNVVTTTLTKRSIVADKMAPDAWQQLLERMWTVWIAKVTGTLEHFSELIAPYCLGMPPAEYTQKLCAYAGIAVPQRAATASAWAEVGKRPRRERGDKW